MKISWITAKVFLSGNLLKRVKWNEEETSIDGDTPIAIQPKLKNRTRQIWSLSDQSSILEQKTPSNVKPWKGMDPSFLDLSASASGGQETEEDEEEDFYLDDELDDFIVNSVSTKDSESMMAIYRTALNSVTRTPKCIARKTQSSSYYVTPGVTPFSQQTDYDSSFVTDGSGSSGP